MSQKLLLGGFKWVNEASQLNEDFISYNEYGVQCSKELHEPHNDLALLPENKRNWKIWKTCSKLAW